MGGGEAYCSPACLLVLAVLGMAAGMPDEGTGAEVVDGDGPGVDVLWRCVSGG